MKWIELVVYDVYLHDFMTVYEVYEHEFTHITFMTNILTLNHTKATSLNLYIGRFMARHLSASMA